MNQKKLIILVSVLLALVLIGGGAYYLKTRSAPEEQQQTVAPVDYGTENPLEKAPDLDPTTKTNPFSKVRTNPFE